MKRDTARVAALQTPLPVPGGLLYWDFHVRAVRGVDGIFNVAVTLNRTQHRITTRNVHPVTALIRALIALSKRHEQAT